MPCGNPTQQSVQSKACGSQDFDLLIHQLLAEEQQVSLVEQFARAHEGGLAPSTPSYTNLIPLSQPGEGEQYAFEVDLDLCSGCKACVTACHALNGLDDSEAWRDVGLLASPPPTIAAGPSEEFIQQTVTTACHHCVDPACLNGCPVLAYEKDPGTGIVRHLDDQCIGCQYCMMKCPYDVPKYSDRLGIVRKCDMCHTRLSHEEAPACAQACPNQAITIGLVSKAVVENRYRDAGPSPDEGNRFLPSTPSPDYTLPTTLYRTGRSGASTLRAANAAFLEPANAHYPLTFLLLLTQLSVGLMVASLGCSLLGVRLSPLVMPMAVAALLAGLAVGLAHLGRPSKAWKSFLGWRKSWFSREVILFGVYAGMLCCLFGLTFLEGSIAAPRWLLPATALAGLLGVFSSVMIYADCRREFWSCARTSARFFGTTLLLGLAGLQASGSLPAANGVGVWILILLTSLLKGAAELLDLRKGTNSEALTRSVRLMRGALLAITLGRMTTLVVGGVLVPLLALGGMAPRMVVVGAFGLLVASEWLERVLFFRAVSPNGMPGGFRT